MSETSTDTVVWTEIPVRDLDAARRFYEAVFRWTMVPEEGSPNPMLNFPMGEAGVGGHLYPGAPAEGGGPTIHLRVPDGLEAATDRLRASGGTVLDVPVVEIPVGRFRYCTDPDGNSIGLYEPKAR